MGLPERLARASARRPLRVLAAWGVALLVSFGLIGGLLGDALDGDGDRTDRPESTRAEERAFLGFPPQDRFQTDEVIVVRAGARTADVAQAVRGDVLATGAARAVAPPERSADGQAAMLAVDLDPMRGEDRFERVLDVVAAARAPGAEVTITGDATWDHDESALAESDLRDGELKFGLPAALIILLLVFGTVVGGLVPVVMAFVSIVVALALTALVGQLFDLSEFVVNILVGMGLALGIDYSLFVLTRVREERRRGASVEEAIAAAGATSSRAVLFSGAAFVLALLSMILVPDLILRSLGTGAVLVGAVAVVAALTLLPALLALLGDRVEALRLPVVGRRSGRDPAAGVWARVVRAVLRRPALSLVAGLAVMLALAAPLLGMERGFSGVSTLPDATETKRGHVAYTEAFGGGGQVAPAIVVGRDDPELLPGMARLRDALASDDAYGAVEYGEGRAGVVAALVEVRGDANAPEAVDAARRLRERHVPAAFGTETEVLVGGESAENLDYAEMVDVALPAVIAFVLALSFVLLTVAFRSIVVAAKAVLLNLLSVAAAYGLLVLVFQHGVGNELLGVEQVDVIEAWVPLLLFAVLFGLSMDYHVFLLSRIRERYLATGSNEQAILEGIGSTARLITGAALIIVAVFAGFMRGELVMFQQMGFGVAVALLLDATLVRTVLVPAAMALLGERNWWLPRWLGWLPRVSVEGPARAG